MLTHYGDFLFCLGGKDARKTASSLRRATLGRVFFYLKSTNTVITPERTPFLSSMDTFWLELITI